MMLEEMRSSAVRIFGFNALVGVYIYHIGSDMMNIKPTTFFPVLIVVLITLQVSGCRDNFQPLTHNNRYSLTSSGYLALHVDTQWVRVMPIGKTLIPKTGERNNFIGFHHP